MGINLLRDHICARLATVQVETDPLDRLLRDVEGVPPQSFIDFHKKDPIPAAVLVGLVERSTGLAVLFTERSAHLKDHPSQVSFPGGRMEKHDAGPVEAALREAEEEVGLNPKHVSVAGRLERLPTSSGFVVTPVVAFISSEFEPDPDSSEVLEAFEVPLKFLANKENRRVTYRERFGAKLHGYEIEYGGHKIWGVTASILVGFLDL
jgi:8-oxo-dGTP pyrophosphatase MutT (NUDIX family)